MVFLGSIINRCKEIFMTNMSKLSKLILSLPPKTAKAIKIIEYMDNSTHSTQITVLREILCYGFRVNYNLSRAGKVWAQMKTMQSVYAHYTNWTSADDQNQDIMETETGWCTDPSPKAQVWPFSAHPITALSWRTKLAFFSTTLTLQVLYSASIKLNAGIEKITKL